MNLGPFSASYAQHLTPYRLGQPARPRPLARFLPVLPAGLFSPLAVPARSFTFDPFGISPDLDLELAHAGHTVLVCVNNPVVRILLELAAHPPSDLELDRCAHKLADSLKGQQTLQTHIQALYKTICPGCGQSIQAAAYQWERDAVLPFAREIVCPHCWLSGTFPIDESDEQTLQPVRRAPLQRAWAIERIAAPGDPLRQDAVDVVDSHLPRPLYVIFSLINRLETLDLDEREKLILNGLLLSVLDNATPLQSLERGGARPLQLVVPNKYRELNLWNSFELAIQSWRGQAKKVRLTCFPELPEGAGICLFPGRIKELADQPLPLPVERVITAIPRPNQAFWTLSAAWSAWLLGRESATGMAQVIARRRYDWAWHTSALAASLRLVRQISAEAAPIETLIPELEPPFLASFFHAMHQAGLTNQTLSLRPEDDLARCTWQIAPPSTQTATSAPRRLTEEVARACEDYLLEKGEPADYLEMTSAACLAMDRLALWPDSSQTQISPLQQMRAAFSNPILFSHYGPGEQTLESGLWYIRRAPSGAVSLTDRVEEAALQILAGGQAISLPELEQRIRERIQPIFTPLEEYLRHIVQSYADEDPPESGRWMIRVHEHPALRETDIRTICGLIDTLGRRLGFEPKHNQAGIDWFEPGGAHLRYHFQVQSHARVSALLSASGNSTAIQTLVMPGSRSNLLTYKLKQNPLLEDQMREGWHLTKFRHISRLAENPMITTDSLQLWLDGDPPEYQPMQMDLF